MKKATVSFNVGKHTSIGHNNREHIYGNPDIDVSKLDENIIYKQQDIEDAYKFLFDEAVADYNEKQTRSDRKIEDYYRKVLHDKKTEHQREIIVAVGTKGDEIQTEIKENILDEYMKEFEQRNPNLKVYNAVLHKDEANPHLHINYIPTYESKRGLSKRVAQNKAIEQQGYSSFEEWRRSETGWIETLMNDYDLEREKVGSHDYMKVSEYKAYKESLNDLENQIKQRKEALKKLPNLAKNEVKTTQRVSKLNRKEVVVSKDEYDQVLSLAVMATDQSKKAMYYKRNENEWRSEVKKLKTERDHFLTQRDKLARANRKLWFKGEELERENSHLKVENKTLKEELKDIFKFLDDKFKENEFIVGLMNLIPFFKKLREQEKERLEASKQEKRFIRKKERGGFQR